MISRVWVNCGFSWNCIPLFKTLSSKVARKAPGGVCSRLGEIKRQDGERKKTYMLCFLDLTADTRNRDELSSNEFVALENGVEHIFNESSVFLDLRGLDSLVPSGVPGTDTQQVLISSRFRRFG